MKIERGPRQSGSIDSNCRILVAMIRCLTALLLVSGVAPRAAAAAGESKPMRVVVRIVAASDGQLVSRIDGQIADLNVALVRDRSAHLATTIQQRYERARQLARRHNARVVVWFDTAGNHAVRVFVAEPGRDTLFARRVATADASARAEAIAIVVRTTLHALAQGGRIGVRMSRPTPRPPPPTTRAVTTPWQWQLGVQAQLSFDGESSPGQQGFMGRVGAARGRLYVGVVGVVGLSDQLSDDMTTVYLARHSAGIGAAVLATRSRRSALWLGVDAGLIAYTRSTTVVAGSLSAAPPSTNLAGFVAPLVRGQWRPLANAGLWLTFEVAAAAVVGAPELRYQLGNTTVVRNELWPIQPRVGVGVRLEGL